MLYNVSDPLQRQQFLDRAALLAKRGGAVELTSKVNRSLSQNAYLHSILGYFALRYGETLDYVKVVLFKQTVNPDIFYVWRENELRGRFRALRSSSSLTVEEMSLAIDRFRNWSAKNADVYLPSAAEGEMLRAIDIEISRNKEYI